MGRQRKNVRHCWAGEDLKSAPRGTTSRAFNEQACKTKKQYQPAAVNSL
jgi:hypothetical protein